MLSTVGHLGPGPSVPKAQWIAARFLLLRQNIGRCVSKGIESLFGGSLRTDIEALPQIKVSTINDNKSQTPFKGDEERFYPIKTIATGVRSQCKVRSSPLTKAGEFVNTSCAKDRQSEHTGRRSVHTARPSGFGEWPLCGGETDFSGLCDRMSWHSWRLG